jgi:hypothetical protein
MNLGNAASARISVGPLPPPARRAPATMARSTRRWSSRFPRPPRSGASGAAAPCP